MTGHWRALGASCKESRAVRLDKEDSMNGPLHAFLADDHARLDALLRRTMDDPARIDAAAYAAFRAGLRKQIGMEERILLPAAQRARGTMTCVVASAKALQEVMAAGHVLIDNGGRIVAEDRDNFRATGQPGPGDAFFRWLLTHEWGAEKVTPGPYHPGCR